MRPELATPARSAPNAGQQDHAATPTDVTDLLRDGHTTDSEGRPLLETGGRDFARVLHLDALDTTWIRRNSIFFPF
jgi:hypothetical protein